MTSDNNNNQTPPGLPLLDLKSLISTKPKPLDYVLPSFPAGCVGVLSGAGGTGKSMLALQLLYMVAAGNGCDFSLQSGAWQQPENTPSKVILLSAEDTENIVHHRMHAIHEYFNRDEIRSRWTNDLLDLIQISPLVGTGFSLMDSHGCKTSWYARTLEACRDSRLVIIDTMRRSHDANENDNGMMSIFLKLAESLAKETGAAIILLHHENKAGMGDENAGSGALRGASAIVDNSRWVGRVQKMTENDAKTHKITNEDRKWFMKLTLEKTNYGPPLEPVWLKRLEGGVLEAFDLKVEKTTPAAGGRRNVE